MLNVTSSELAVSDATLIASAVSSTILLPAITSIAAPVGIGTAFKKLTLLPSLLSILTVAYIVLPVMLLSVKPSIIVVVTDGEVYTAVFVFAAIADPSSVFNLNVFAMCVYPKAIARAVASSIAAAAVVFVFMRAVIVVEKLASSPRAAANSLRVFSAAGELSINALI